MSGASKANALLLDTIEASTERWIRPDLAPAQQSAAVMSDIGSLSSLESSETLSTTGDDWDVVSSTNETQWGHGAGEDRESPHTPAAPLYQRPPYVPTLLRKPSQQSSSPSSTVQLPNALMYQETRVERPAVENSWQGTNPPINPDVGDTALQLAIESLSYIRQAFRDPKRMAELLQHPDSVAGSMSLIPKSSIRSPFLGQNRSTPHPARPSLSLTSDCGTESSSFTPSDTAAVPVRTVESLAMDLINFYPEAGGIAEKMLEACEKAVAAAIAKENDPRERTSLHERVRNLEGVLDITLARMHAAEVGAQECKKQREEWAPVIASQIYQ